jgi:aspartyl-tRNA(Asn)/glutamyl-tRNA(Gln) amidotransferase subunit A
VKARVEESLKKLEEMGAILVEIDLNMTEAYANLLFDCTC